MKNTLRLALTAAIIAAAPMAAHAHRQWMLPSATVLSGNDPWLTVDAAVSNDLFYFEHQPMRLDGVKAIAPDGTEAKIENASTGRYRSTFDVHLTQSGTYKVMSGGDMLSGSYKVGAETKRWRGTPPEIPAGATEVRTSQNQRRLEVFVTKGAPTTTVLTPTGKGLEMVPVTHPNDLFAGEEATFKLQLDGKPAGDVEVEVVPGGIRYRDSLNEMKLKTAADGSFKVKWPEPGMYWLEASVRDDKATVPNAQRSASYITVLEVLKP
ncbi:DUF4198 domain-containing protein [Caulobacter sp. NIBR2454]|uniref:DUF4198 domain-containing protein n=1 Tax=Caulobacter sp. NIBR2454 TaxID=3015996 RepID=UPI0022B6B002|nr:DUF4198 domain-containing protein [Caulobacter sp. NIBR2454]